MNCVKFHYCIVKRNSQVLTNERFIHRYASTIHHQTLMPVINRSFCNVHRYTSKSINSNIINRFVNNNSIYHHPLHKMIQINPTSFSTKTTSISTESLANNINVESIHNPIPKKKSILRETRENRNYFNNNNNNININNKEINFNSNPDTFLYYIKESKQSGITNFNKHFSIIISYLINPSIEWTCNQLYQMIYTICENNSKHSDQFYTVLQLLSNKLLSTSSTSSTATAATTTGIGISTEICPEKNICMAILEMKSVDTTRIEVLSLIKTLTFKLKGFQNKFTPHSIKLLAYGFGQLSYKNEIAQDFFKTVLLKLESCEEIIRLKTLVFLIYNIRHIQSNTISSQELSKILLPKIELCTDCFNADDLSKICFGLQNFTFQSLEEKNILVALLPKIESCSEFLSGQEIERIFTGIQNIEYTSFIEYQFLKAMIPIIQTANSSSFTVNNISKIIMCLKHMNSDHPVVIQLLQVLMPIFKSYTRSLPPAVIGQVFTGLRNMKGDQPIVLELLAYLTVKLDLCKRPFTYGSMGAILSSIQNVLSDSNTSNSNSNTSNSTAISNSTPITNQDEILKRFFNALVIKLKSCNELLTFNDITLILLNLQNIIIPENQELLLIGRQFLKVLAKKVESCNNNDSSLTRGLINGLIGLENMKYDFLEESRHLYHIIFHKIISSKLVLNAADVMHVLHGIKNLNADDVEVRQFISAIIPKIESCNAILNGPLCIGILTSSSSSFSSVNQDNEEVCQLRRAIELKSVGDIQANELDEQAIVTSSLPTPPSSSLSSLPVPSSSSSSSLPLSQPSSSSSQPSSLSLSLQETIQKIDMKEILVKTTQEDVDTYFNHNINEYNQYDITYFIKSAGFQITNIQLIHHYPKLLNYLKTTKEIFTSKNLYILIYALGVNANVKTEMMYEILSVLTKKLYNTPLSNVNNNFNICIVLSGMVNFTHDRIEVNELLRAITIEIQSSTEIFTSSDLSMALYGLNHMSSDVEEVCQLLRVLSPKVESCQDLFTSHDIGSALYGLKSMNSDALEVRQLLQVLTNKLKMGKDILSSLTIHRSLHFLQNMNILTSSEVLDFVKVLIPRIEKSTKPLRTVHIPVCLYGFKNMKDSLEMRQLARAFIFKIQTCFGGEISVYVLKKSLNVLMSSNNQCDELNQLIKAIEQIVDPAEMKKISNSNSNNNKSNNSNNNINNNRNRNNNKRNTNNNISSSNDDKSNNSINSNSYSNSNNSNSRSSNNNSYSYSDNSRSSNSNSRSSINSNNCINSRSNK